jgi:hypothetical protein
LWTRQFNVYYARIRHSLSQQWFRFINAGSMENSVSLGIKTAADVLRQFRVGRDD